MGANYRFEEDNFLPRDHAFDGCTGLADAAIPASVTNIGQDAFTGCSALSDVYFGGRADEASVLNSSSYELAFAEKHFMAQFGACGADGDRLGWALDAAGCLTVFGAGCMADYTGSYEGSNVPWLEAQPYIETVVLKSGVTSVGESAFYGCGGLRTVTLPASLIYVAPNAFYGCSYLTDVCFDGDSTQWSGISFSSGNDKLQTANLHYPMTVSFIANGGTGEMEPQTMYAGMETALKRNAFTNGELDFLRWNTAANGTGTNYTDMETVTLNGDTTLYAQWESDGPTVIDSGACGDNLTWTLYSDNGSGWLIISGSGAMADFGTYPYAPWRENQSMITVLLQKYKKCAKQIASSRTV